MNKTLYIPYTMMHTAVKTDYDVMGRVIREEYADEKYDKNVIYTYRYITDSILINMVYVSDGKINSVDIRYNTLTDEIIRCSTYGEYIEKYDEYGRCVYVKHNGPDPVLDEYRIDYEYKDDNTVIAHKVFTDGEHYDYRVR